MKKASVFLTIISFISLLFLALYYYKFKDFSLIIILSLFFILFLSYFYFEKSSMGTKEIAVIATLSTFGAVLRVPFAAIPNVQPTTFIVAISGYVFGVYEGFLIGSTTAVISNIFLGQGPWTPWQMFAWGVVGALSGLIGKREKKLSVETFSILCFFYGFLFDWIMNLWFILGFIKPLTIKSIVLAYVSGLTVDVMHSFGNFIFSIIFYSKFLKVLNRFKNRLRVTYIKNEGE